MDKYIIKFYINDLSYTFEIFAENSFEAIEKCKRNVKRNVDLINILPYVNKIECFLARLI